MAENGWIPVIVHGGGPAITGMLDRMGVESRFVDGLRVTDEATLDVVEMVLAGSINKQVVRRIQAVGGMAVGLSGIDGMLLEAQCVADKRAGWVGEVVQVNVELLRGLISLGYIPVISPVGVDRKGQRYNINADTAAGAVASSLGVQQLVVVTDVPGIMRGSAEHRVMLPKVTLNDIEEMIASAEIYGGMIPKVKAAVQCMRGNVEEVAIVSGTQEGVLHRLMAGESVGTRIIKNKEGAR